MTGRQRRRQYEYQQLMKFAEGRKDVSIAVTREDADGIPCAYVVTYNIHSICGINDDRTPVFADVFTMLIDIPEDYPQIDAPPVFRFTKHTEGVGSFKKFQEVQGGQEVSESFKEFQEVSEPTTHNPSPTTQETPLPWHPNIRYHGDMAGHVCLNALNTFTDLAWGVERVALYLRYELYHALPEPPYPEDLTVAEWVRHVGEPNEYIFFNQ